MVKEFTKGQKHKTQLLDTALLAGKVAAKVIDQSWAWHFSSLIPPQTFYERTIQAKLSHTITVLVSYNDTDLRRSKIHFQHTP
jgi:hypothetical protein